MAYAASYALFSHAPEGLWLKREFVTHMPVSQTVLGFAAPLIVDLWFLLLCGGLFALLYWLLGRPWQRVRVDPAAPPSETSAALA